MKQVFFDKTRSVYVKVFPDDFTLEKEFFGRTCFSSFVQVPEMRQLDSKVAVISEVQGFLGYQVLEDDLNQLFVSLLKKLKPIIISKNNFTFSIFAELKKMKKFFHSDTEAMLFLNTLSKQLENEPLFPVHGDIQKLNMIVNEGRLGLIDFEHFVIAPRELELVNSVFFADGNCLNVLLLSNLLPQEFLDLKMLQLMLRYYHLKQIMLGLDRHSAMIQLEKGQRTLQECKVTKQMIWDNSLNSFFDQKNRYV